MRLFARRNKQEVDRFQALNSVPVLNPGIELERQENGTLYISIILRRGKGLFEKMRPKESKRSYELDEFGAFVAKQIDGKRDVIAVINAFEKKFKMARRDCEMSVVAFIKLLMQRSLVSVLIAKSKLETHAEMNNQNVKPLLSALLMTLLLPLFFLHLEASDLSETKTSLENISANSRAVGTPGNIALEKDVAARFKKSAFKSGVINFNTPAFKPGKLSLNCGSIGKFEFEAMHPTLMRPGNFQKNQFDTRLVYLHKGGPKGLKLAEGIDLKNTIAVMDYESGDEWLELLRFGVIGFIFVGDGESSHQHAVSKVFNTEVSVPRFFIDNKEGELLISHLKKNKEISAKAVSIPSLWKKTGVNNHWVLIPGKDPELNDKVIVFTAAIDANSVVPARAYGAQRAVNLHILLKLLEDFKLNPPGYSVMLVAVNAHTQLYAGERTLAWYLLADAKNIETVRDEMGKERRLAKLHQESYSKLQLKALNSEDKKDLHISIDVLWHLDNIYKEKRLADSKEVETEKSAFNISKLTKKEIDHAIEKAKKELIESYSSFFSASSGSKEELEKEKNEDLIYFQKLKALSLEQFIAKAKRLKSTFEDEKLLEKWRSDMDESSGKRIYIKTMLQDEFKSKNNRTTQDIMFASSDKYTTLAESERKVLIAKLNEEKKNALKILILFNKMDIGIGRSRTRYRQIAKNDIQRELLKSAVDKFITQFKSWQIINKQYEDHDISNDSIRDALGVKKVALNISLELDSNTKQFGLCYYTPERKFLFKDAETVFMGFGKICNEIALELENTTNSNPYVDALSEGLLAQLPYYFNDLNSAARHLEAAAGTPSLAAKPVFSSVGRTFGPYDNAQKIDFKQIHSLQKWAREFFALCCSNKELFTPDNIKPRKKVFKAWSTHIRTFTLDQFTGKPIPTKAIPNTLVAVYRRTVSTNYDSLENIAIIGGEVNNTYSGITDEAGNLYLYGIASRRGLAPLAYQMDSDFKEVLHTIDKGRIQTSKQVNSNIGKSPRATLALFECKEYVIKQRYDPTRVGSAAITESKYWLKVADGQSDPDKYGIHGASGLTPAHSHVSHGPIGVYLYKKHAELKQDKLMVITNQKRCVMNSTFERPDGVGFSDRNDFADDFYHQAAIDMAMLNKSRSTSMQGVINQLLDQFLEKGDTLNTKIVELNKKNLHSEVIVTSAEALGTEVKAHQEIDNMYSDMLKAILVYMGLMLPFCYFLQKLIFNFKKMEHELGGFMLLFVSMYVLFRNIHPAFNIAMSPEAIFIAFVLGAIGCFTTLVLHTRFKDEMRLLFQGTGGIGEDASYSAVSSTAVVIGVQNMRRRRIRTSLTMATIILVVFTMLTFSSVSRTASPTLINKSESSPYTGIFFHWPGGNEMDESSYRVLRDVFHNKATTYARRILRKKIPTRLELSNKGETFIAITAITGAPPNDIALADSFAIIEGESFSSSLAYEILLPVSAAEALDLKTSDIGKTKLKMLGHDFLLKGFISDQRYRLARDLNPNLSLVPMIGLPTLGNTDDKETLEVEIPDMNEVIMDTAKLAIIPDGIAAELGAKVRSVSVVFPNNIEPSEFVTQIQRFMLLSDARFYVGSRFPFKMDEKTATAIKPGVYYIGNNYRTSIGGLSKLIIPLCIAGLIILNTMLSTVYERKSEIAIFNAIGLNPTHIFLFFLAEAFVYSLLGAVGGYLIGQVLAILLQFSGLVTEVNINFSSLIVVYVIIFTMGLVMLSTIYPGYMATRSAVPSGKRKWSMPEHNDNDMNIIFPFIYHPNLVRGAIAYLDDFFERLSGESLGDIVAEFIETQEIDDGKDRKKLIIKYKVVLAPYDLGVTQYVTFTAQYDEVVRSYRMHMDIERISGQVTNWVTTNKPFLERMRKYLIRWRNIDPTRQKFFVDQAEDIFKKENYVLH